MAEENLDFNIEQLPFSLEAEQSVLGAILIEPECISRVLELLVPESFYRPQHQQLFSIMLGMFTSAQPIDFITVLEKAKAERIFASDGDAKVYLTQLVQVVPLARQFGDQAQLLCADSAHDPSRDDRLAGILREGQIAGCCLALHPEVFRLAHAETYRA